VWNWTPFQIKKKKPTAMGFAIYHIFCKDIGLFTVALSVTFIGVFFGLKANRIFVRSEPKVSKNLRKINLLL
jgi:hypothetical protein